LLFLASLSKRTVVTLYYYNQFAHPLYKDKEFLWIEKSVIIKFMNADKNYPKPFLKWAGGKTQLLNELESRLPKEIRERREIDCYIEAFTGGGALFFFLKSRYKIRKSYLIDNNRDLILAYKVIKKHPEKLLKKLSLLEKKYLRENELKRADFYYHVRDAYNRQLLGFDYEKFSEQWIERTGSLIFLNKTCFNGLYRLNAKGDYNVPHGRYKNPKIYDPDNIQKVSKALLATKIIYGDFSKCSRYAQKGTLVYFDPPYRPISLTSNFTGYTKKGFSDNDQIRLANLCKELADKGVYILLSNSDPAAGNKKDKFFENIYNGFNIERVFANRMINCNGEKRGRIQELLISNYQYAIR